MSKFIRSPGHWQSAETLSGKLLVVSDIEPGFQQAICEMKSKPENVRADLMLLRSAPDMLGVLQLISQELSFPAYRLTNSNRRGDQSLGNTLNWAIEQCENAIKRATGGAE